MADVVKTEWFGRQITVLMVNGKSVTGELSEVTDTYIVLTRGKSEVQVMVSAIIMVVPAAGKEQKAQAQAPAEESGPALFGDTD